jgi:apolipoprotein N-acyltransferase
VSPDGEVLQRTGTSEQRVLHDTVELRSGRTWSVRFADWPTLALSALVVAAAWALTRREPRPANP